MKNIPVKLDDKMTAALDRLVDSGLYLSRSEALREGARRLILTDYISRGEWLFRLAKISAELIAANFAGKIVEVRLFGSVAKSDAGIESDIDIAVIVDDPAVNTVEQRIDALLQPVSLGGDVLITPIIIGRKELARRIKDGFTLAKEIEQGIPLLTAGKIQDAVA